MNNFQKTLDENLYFQGIGLHTGKSVNLTLKPAPENHGIVFFRTDLNEYIEASWKNLQNSKLCTVIVNSNNVSVSTIEHLMAAIYATQIDNVLVEIDGPEVPILDGSSIEYILQIKKHTRIQLNHLKKWLKIKKEIFLQNDFSSVKILPSEETFLRVDFSIEFDAQIIGKQKCSYLITENNFEKHLAKSRTFAQLSEIDFLKKSGLALGGSLNNAIVVDHDKVLNPEGLRYKDEFVRHKTLDAVGDLYLCQYQIIGHFIGNKSSHALTTQLITKVMENSENYQIIDQNNLLSLKNAG